MGTVLYIEASPLKQRSHTIEAARAFLDAYAGSHRDDTIDTLDLWAEVLPAFDGMTIAAKFAVLRGNEFTNKNIPRFPNAASLSCISGSLDGSMPRKISQQTTTFTTRPAINKAKS